MSERIKEIDRLMANPLEKCLFLLNREPQTDTQRRILSYVAEALSEEKRKIIICCEQAKTRQRIIEYMRTIPPEFVQHFDTKRRYVELINGSTIHFRLPTDIFAGF